MPAPAAPAAAAARDPELEALPDPRRPWRRTTIATLAVTALLSGSLAWGLRSPAWFSAWTGPPRDLGPLAAAHLGREVANGWVRAEGRLHDRAVEYRRPLEHDRFRLTGVEGRPEVWVALRVPADIDPAHYVAPNSFVGRLVPLGEAGMGEAALSEVIATALGHAPPGDAWVLLDGDTPATTRWAAGLALLFVGFAAFNVWGLFRLLQPVADGG